MRNKIEINENGISPSEIFGVNREQMIEQLEKVFGNEQGNAEIKDIETFWNSDMDDKIVAMLIYVFGVNQGRERAKLITSLGLGF